MFFTPVSLLKAETGEFLLFKMYENVGFRQFSTICYKIVDKKVMI